MTVCRRMAGRLVNATATPYPPDPMSIAAPSRSRRRPSGAPTVADVARLAGCSPMTVSRVINGEARVRDATREAVQSAIARLNYRPNSAARSLAGAGQMRLALLYANPSASYLSEVLVGALDEAARVHAQLTVELCALPRDGRATVDRLIEARVDGLLLPPPLSDDGMLLAHLRETGTPAVAIGPGRAPKGTAAVTIDDRRAAHDMTRHLIELGHRRIGFIRGDTSLTVSGERWEGFVEALKNAHLPVLSQCIEPGQFTYASGRRAAERILNGHGRPTAIFAANDDMAAAAVAVAHQRGLDVPRDLSIVGFDDTALATTMWPELTTVHQPVADMARAAVELLVDQVRLARAGEAAVPVTRVLDHRLVLRDSAAAPRNQP